MPETDPVRERSAAMTALFVLYLRRYFGRNFHALRLSGLPPAPQAGRPLIIFSNHPSWWDPVVFLLLAATLVPDRAGYGPMDAAMLENYRILRRIGVFGLEPGRRGAASFLRNAERILANSSSALWITAQGTFADARVRPIRLRPGVAHLARRLGTAAVLPLALDYVFWNERRPEVLARFGPQPAPPADNSVPAWTAALERALETCMNDLTEDAQARDPSRFRTLLEGTVGIGGVYDVMRRLSASARGRRFEPSHEGRR